MALEAARPPRIPTARETFPWLTDEGVGKVADATLEAACVAYEMTRDSPASMEAAAAWGRELALRLRDDPAAEAEALCDFEIVRPEAIPTVERILDAVGHRGDRRYPNATDLYLARRDCEDLGGRMVRPWPPGIPQEPFIEIPAQTHSDRG